MKYLFIVQGEGRGHLTQAIALSDMLVRNGHQVVEVLVGKSKNREIPSFFAEKVGAPIFIYQAPNFIYSKKKKKVSLTKSILYNITPKRIKNLLHSMELIHERIKQNEPDVIINFYEMTAGLTTLRFNIDVPIIAIGHQFLMQHPNYVHGKGDEQGKFFLRLHALLCSIGATKSLALSFYPMKDSFKNRIAVVPPLLRKEVLALNPVRGEYLLGYLLNHGFSDEIKKWSYLNPKHKLDVFWDKSNEPEKLKVSASLTMHRINDTSFLEKMEQCNAYISTAGFESVCEAIYLGKPIMLVPAHIEQEINAADAIAAYGGIRAEEFNLDKLIDYLNNYTDNSQAFRDWVNEAESYFMQHLTKII
ncbi:MAG: glycosyltransferase family protein [Phocaeicola sp.]